MKSPWPVVLAWGSGWAGASLLLPASVRLVDPSSPPSVFAAALLVGGLLFGLPIYVTGRQAGVRSPAVEAVLWISLLAVVAVVFALATRPAFGAVNAVTTEDIRRRQQGGTWPYPMWSASLPPHS